MGYSTELRFAAFSIGLYTTFIYWGYLQEKLTSSSYEVQSNGILPIGSSLTWNNSFALNLFMSITGTITAFFADIKNKKSIPAVIFWKASITSALASPIGYASLKYISYPMMILTKSSKPVPVMLVGVMLYKRVYKWYKYVGVLLLCCGIALFTASKSAVKGSAVTQDNHPWYHQLFGVVLIFVNLCLDGYTNNEQDHIYASHGATPLQMMKFTNVWQSMYLFAYLLVGLLLDPSTCELTRALQMVYLCPAIRFDLVMFCLCASVGQILICGLIKEFGSLAWITLSVTRQLFTVLLSVFIFRHSVNTYQWVGIALVFSGLALEAIMVFLNKESNLSAKPAAMNNNSDFEWEGAARGRIESDDLERNGSEKRSQPNRRKVE